jgi:hypothetical protein
LIRLLDAENEAQEGRRRDSVITNFAQEIEMMRKRWDMGVVVVSPSMALQV